MFDVDIVVEMVSFIFSKGITTSVCTEDVEMYRQLQWDYLAGKY
jgi:hypothetical protein